MNQKRRKAKQALDYILLHQKTVTVSRLQEILDVLKYDRIEADYNSLRSKIQKEKEKAKGYK